MAYGAILGQMPQIDGIPAVIESYPIATGNTIAQGDVVDVVDGQIQKTLTPQANVETSIEKLAWSYTKTEKISTSKLAVMSNRTSATPPLNVWVFDVSAEGIISNIKGTDVIGDIIPYNNVNARSFSVISEEKIVVFYNQSNNKTIRAKVCTINENNTLSLGSAKATEEFSDFPSVIESIFLDNDAVIVFSNDSGLNARICTISGTTPTWLPNTYRLSGNTSAAYISATRLPDSGTTRRVCVCYRDGGDSNKGKAVIVSINASNNITWGTPVVFESNAIAGALSCCASGNDVVVTFNTDSPRTQYVELLIVSETKISNTSAISTNILSQSLASIVECKDNTYVLTFCKAPSPYTGVSFVITRSSDTLNIGDPFYFSSVFNGSSTPINQNQVLVAYADGDNSHYGTATILTVSGNQIAGSFSDGSKDAIVLQSGTSGQSIEVIYSGITNADWVTAGQTITSDGVYGAGVLDGVLQVWSKDRPLGAQIITGSYAGTGKNGSGNPNSLTFPVPVDYVIFVGYRTTSGRDYTPFIQSSSSSNPVFSCFVATEDYTQSIGPYSGGDYENSYGKISEDGKTIFWYNTSSPSLQLNSSDNEYFYIAFYNGRN